MSKPTAPSSGPVALTDRDPADILFRLPGRNVTAGQFAADALRLAARLPDAGHALNLCQGRYAFAVAFAAALLRGQASILSSDVSPQRIAALQLAYPGLHVLDAETEPGHDSAPIPAIPGDRCAALVYTSGSTGEPQGHAKDWAALVSRSRAAASAFRLHGPVSVVGTVPPRHMYGFETTVLLPLHAPAAAWCGPAFFPADMAAALHGVPGPRLLVTTPLQLRALVQAGPALPPLAGVVSATAPLPPSLAEAAELLWDTAALSCSSFLQMGSEKS